MPNQSKNQIRPLFALGKTVATPGALVAMLGMGISAISLLSRHQRGDWGDMDEEDKQANNLAAEQGSRVMSSYLFDTVKLWVITEADRSITTILLPEEY